MFLFFRGFTSVRSCTDSIRISVGGTGRWIGRFSRLHNTFRVFIFQTIRCTRLDLDITVRRIFDRYICWIVLIVNLTVVFCEGWAIAPEERDWKYRLSIYYAKPQDSGTFTCATPRGITNSITLHVAGKVFDIWIWKMYNKKKHEIFSVFNE